MAQGEFALLKENLLKATALEKDDLSDPDIYALLVDAAVQQRDRTTIETYTPILEQTVAPTEHKLYLATAHRAWGVWHRLEGRYEEAQASLSQAADLFQGLDTRWQLGRTYIELGKLAAEQSHTAEARQRYAEALSLFEEMGALPDADRARARLDSLL